MTWCPCFWICDEPWSFFILGATRTSRTNRSSRTQRWSRWTGECGFLHLIKLWGIMIYFELRLGALSENYLLRLYCEPKLFYIHWNILAGQEAVKSMIIIFILIIEIIIGKFFPLIHLLSFIWQKDSLEYNLFPTNSCSHKSVLKAYT